MLKQLFRHPIDAAPVGLILLGLSLSLFAAFMPFSAAMTLVGLTGVVLRILVPIHQHYHAHLSTFRSNPHNRAYDFALCLAGGNLTTLWKVHHCMAHHRDFLDPRNDIEGNLRFGEDIPCRQLVFTVLGDALSLRDSLRSLRGRSPEKRRELTRRIFIELFLQVLALVLLLELRPIGMLAWIVVPNLFLRWSVFWYSYHQHDRMPMRDVYSCATTNFTLNRPFLNVGLHTAHHERPALHWSQLEGRTRLILDRIPSECLRGLTSNGTLATVQGSSRRPSGKPLAWRSIRSKP